MYWLNLFYYIDSYVRAAVYSTSMLSITKEKWKTEYKTYPGIGIHTAQRAWQCSCAKTWDEYVQSGPWLVELFWKQLCDRCHSFHGKPEGWETKTCYTCSFTFFFARGGGVGLKSIVRMLFKDAVKLESRSLSYLNPAVSHVRSKAQTIHAVRHRVTFHILMRLSPSLCSDTFDDAYLPQVNL